MATLRELKTRIGSVASSEKITGAMKMISSAKVHKFESSLKQLVPYRNQITSIMGHILSSDVQFTSPLIEQRTDIKRIAIVVFGSDDGLCGAYNINISKYIRTQIANIQSQFGHNLDIELYPVGRKMVKALSKLASEHIRIIILDDVDSKMPAAKVNELTLSLEEKFSSKHYDMVWVGYMRYFSMSRQRPQFDLLFPISMESLLSGQDKADANCLYIFEPDPNSIFNAVLPMFVLSTMQEISIENRTSEQAARVMAMQSANDNAKKLLEALHLEYNKLRQENITTELLDILGGQVER